ncbi:unnamed protein product [Effrenium voratum]|nr:unnamed protein product [Effrenium voratum]
MALRAVSLLRTWPMLSAAVRSPGIHRKTWRFVADLTEEIRFDGPIVAEPKRSSRWWSFAWHGHTLEVPKEQEKEVEVVEPAPAREEASGWSISGRGVFVGYFHIVFGFQSDPRFLNPEICVSLPSRNPADDGGDRWPREALLLPIGLHESMGREGVGIRSCTLCSDPALRERFGLHPVRKELPHCHQIFTLVDWSWCDGSPHLLLRGESGEVVSGRELPLPFDGLQLFEEVMSEDAEREILAAVQRWPWQPSQSGRWKQDFGPKANFKRQQVKLPEAWHGFPRVLREMLERLRPRSPTLGDFEPVECLSLWYDTLRGASHALHVDDLWLWGDRILGISPLGF